MAFQKPTGTQDIFSPEIEKWQVMEDKARELCRKYRYREIRTPIFEHTALFQRGVGEATDIVEKEMYTFKDRGNRDISLRPEGTAGVVRAYLENKMYGDPEICKLYYIGPMFRYERPQAGRYRQLHQFGVEAFGSDDPALDAELIALGLSFYRELGLTGVRAEINSIGTPACREVHREKLREFFAPVKEKLCADCQSRYDRNPLRILDCKVDQAYCAGAPTILEYLDEESRDHFDKVQQYLTDMGIEFAINPGLVRGLDYYTHTVFEFKAQGIGAIDTIGGGGRYNGLVSEIGGRDQFGAGLGIGLERTLLVLAAQGVELPAEPPLDVYLIAMGDEAERVSVRLLYDLRARGLRAERDYLRRSVKSRMKAADRNKARFVAILGEDELKRGEITVKKMATGEQKAIALEQLAQNIFEEEN
jgi:histidyl-tRNA synthetase